MPGYIKRPDLAIPALTLTIKPKIYEKTLKKLLNPNLNPNY
jgi:hypothetical protein